MGKDKNYSPLTNHSSKEIELCFGFFLLSREMILNPLRCKKSIKETLYRST